jgi:hypothetical protein
MTNDHLARRASRAALDAAHRGAGYAPIRHGLITSRGELVRSTAESDDVVFAHLPVGHPNAVQRINGHHVEADAYAGLDPWSEAARCVSCGHRQQACECPHTCSPAGAER